MPDVGVLDLRASIGYTVTNNPDQAPEALHRSALYRAKADGRDRIATLR